MSTITEPVTLTRKPWEQMVGKHHDIRKFTINVVRFTEDSLLRTLSLTTINQLHATACLRAWELQRPILLTWAQGKYFDADLVNVELLESAA